MSLNRRNFISMLGLSALVAKVFPKPELPKWNSVRNLALKYYPANCGMDWTSRVIWVDEHGVTKEAELTLAAIQDFTADNQQQNLCTKS